MNNQISVCTCTLGDSAMRLEVLLGELRAFTKVKFRHVVCDDGTLDPDLQDRQKQVCKFHGADWVENPGQPWGISYAWNHALEQVKTPWAFCIEDGLRPSLGWLDTAIDFVEQIGNREWRGRKVGMAGFASIQDWLLALGSGQDVMEVFRGNGKYFWGPWNDGLWCWQRLLPEMMKACEGDTTSWTNDVAIFRDMAIGANQDDLHPMEREQRWLKWRTDNHWPKRRGAFCGWYPGAFMLVNMDAWRKVGRFRDGCTFFEGHLGTRMGMNGYLSLCVESPPFLHTPSLGFKAGDFGRKPRHHEDTKALFLKDFGHDNMDAPNVLATGVVSMAEQQAINEQLAEIKLAMVPGWEKYA